MNLGFNKYRKDDKAKFLLCPKWGKWGILASKISIWTFVWVCFLDFFKIVPVNWHLKLLKVEILEIKKWAKTTVLDFEEKLTLYSRWGKLVRCLNRRSIVTSYLLLVHPVTVVHVDLSNKLSLLKQFKYMHLKGLVMHFQKLFVFQYCLLCYDLLFWRY